MNNPCNSPSNWNGQCCCNCKYRVEIRKHPWNNGEGKGSVLELMGYGCNVFTFLDIQEGTPIKNGGTVVYQSSREHSMCELWSNIEL